MYIPEDYKNNNLEEVKDFLHKNSFGILVNQADGKICATHIPLELDRNENGKDILLGHISKENPQWKSFGESDKVLAIFPGPHSYISSSWYDFEGVPTWNYIAVHVYGNIRIIEGEALLSSLKKLVDKYEANSENPIRVEDLSAKTMRMTRGIVAFEIEIGEIQAQHKLSQNRDKKNHTNIIAQLEKQTDNNALAIAAEMKKCPI